MDTEENFRTNNISNWPRKSTFYLYDVLLYYFSPYFEVHTSESVEESMLESECICRLSIRKGFGWMVKWKTSSEKIEMHFILFNIALWMHKNNILYMLLIILYIIFWILWIFSLNSGTGTNVRLFVWNHLQMKINWKLEKKKKFNLDFLKAQKSLSSYMYGKTKTYSKF